MQAPSDFHPLSPTTTIQPALEKITMHIVCKILDIFDIPVPEYRRWGSKPES